MTYLSLVLLFLIPVSASMAIYAETARPRRAGMVYFFKPLTTVLVIGFAATLPAGDPVYRGAILLGLGACLAGDVLLMLPGDRFLPGLGAFLAGHLAYLAAFTRHAPVASVPVPFLGIGLMATAILSLLWSDLTRRLRVPVVAYVVVLGSMAAQALGQGAAIGGPAAWAGGIGGLLFFFSDAALAYDRFRRKFRAARLVVLGSYWSAQTLIALSITIHAG